MRYIYFDETTNIVEILPDESTEHGVLLGSVSDEDFAHIKTTFLVQSLLYRAGIERSGINIQIVIGPSLQRTR